MLHAVILRCLLDNQVDSVNCGWTCLTELRNGNRDLGTIYRDEYDQTGPPRGRRTQSTGVTSLGSPTFREPG